MQPHLYYSDHSGFSFQSFKRGGGLFLLVAVVSAGVFAHAMPTTQCHSKRTCTSFAAHSFGRWALPCFRSSLLYPFLHKRPRCVCTPSSPHCRTLPCTLPPTLPTCFLPTRLEIDNTPARPTLLHTCAAAACSPAPSTQPTLAQLLLRGGHLEPARDASSPRLLFQTGPLFRWNPLCTASRAPSGRRPK